MPDKQKKILNKIVYLQGNCLNYLLCGDCPLKAKCLPAFLNKATRPSQRERCEMAADLLARVGLMLDVN